MKTKPSWDECRPDPEVSKAVINPNDRLGFAVFFQAVKDLHTKNKALKSLDAMCWLISDAYLYADELDLTIPNCGILCSAAMYMEVRRESKS